MPTRPSLIQYAPCRPIYSAEHSVWDPLRSPEGLLKLPMHFIQLPSALANIFRKHDHDTPSFHTLTAAEFTSTVLFLFQEANRTAPHLSILPPDRSSNLS